MKSLDTTSKLYQPEDAEKVAAELNASDDWVYTAVHDPKGTGFSFIEIHDDIGGYVGRV